MGNSGSQLVPAAHVLEAVAKHEKEKGEPLPLTNKATPADDALPDELKALGVDIGETSMSEARHCWKLLSHQDFWRSHHALHPKRKRVKMWLFVHGKFRAYSASMLQAAEAMQASVASGSDARDVNAAVKGVESSFRSLVSKIEAHSEFEDNQLFRFFRENVPDIREDIRDLEADHSDKQLEQSVLSSLKSVREQEQPEQRSANSEAAADAAVAALKNYTASLERHLLVEERTLVSRWLNLTPELYAKYRSCLKGKYKLVY